MIMRLFAGAAALVFVAAFFALPLYAAATLCTMPCCHHHSSAAQSIVLADLSGCPNCSVSTETTAPTEPIRSITPPSRTVDILAPSTPAAASFSVTPTENRAALDHTQRLHGSTAPIHVLNALFRI